MRPLGTAIASLVVLGSVTLAPTTASAADGFACPAGTDTIAVPFAFDTNNQPQLAGTVCVVSGTTRFQSLDVSAGWSADVKSDGSKGRTEVRFTNAGTGGRVELRYEPGKTVIK